MAVLAVTEVSCCWGGFFGFYSVLLYRAGSTSCLANFACVCGRLVGIVVNVGEKVKGKKKMGKQMKEVVENGVWKKVGKVGK